MIKRLLPLVIALSLLTLVMIGLGGYVRAVGAGLSCPDWPLCYGKVVPGDFSGGVLEEVSHRYLGTVIGLVIIALTLMARRVRDSLPWIWRRSLFLLLLVIVQGTFGGLTVLLKLSPFTVVTHLLLGTLLFQTAAVTAVRLRRESKVTQSSFGWQRFTENRLLWVLIALVVLQIGFGGYVATTPARLACVDIPLCDGTFFPKGEGAKFKHMHMTHRTLGVLLAAGLLFFAVRTAKKGGRKGHIFGITTLTILQVLLGFANVYFAIPPHMTVTHLLLAQLILLGLLTAAIKKPAGGLEAA
jgi:heme a synthase